MLILKLILKIGSEGKIYKINLEVSKDSLIFDLSFKPKFTTMYEPNEFDDFDCFIGPEELQCDNPIDEDFEPDFEQMERDYDLSTGGETEEDSWDMA